MSKKKDWPKNDLNLNSKQKLKDEAAAKEEAETDHLSKAKAEHDGLLTEINALRMILLNQKQTENH